MMHEVRSIVTGIRAFCPPPLFCVSPQQEPDPPYRHLRNINIFIGVMSMGCVTSKSSDVSVPYGDEYSTFARPNLDNDQRPSNQSPPEDHGLYSAQRNRQRPAWLLHGEGESSIPVPSMQLQYESDIKVNYEVTGRGIGKLIGVVYPDSVLEQMTKDMQILDLGAGKGEFVRDLQKLGFKNTRGIDKEEASRGVLRVDIAELDAGHYRKKLDRIFSSWSLFTYKESPDLQRESLQKMAHWLKPNGRIYLGPVDAWHMDNLIEQVPQLVKSDSGTLFGSDDQHWLELKLNT